MAKKFNFLRKWNITLCLVVLFSTSAGRKNAWSTWILWESDYNHRKRFRSLGMYQTGQQHFPYFFPIFFIFLSVLLWCIYDVGSHTNWYFWSLNFCQNLYKYMLWDYWITLRKHFRVFADSGHKEDVDWNAWRMETLTVRMSM